jgi:hypothetical protein
VLVGEVDWVEVGALATGIAALVTAGLAAFTAKMASATKAMAEATQAQVDLSRRHVAAAETSVEQTERSMGATLEPRLRLVRITGEETPVSLDDSGFSIMLVNEGPVAATLTEARINLPPQFFNLEQVPGGAIQPQGGQAVVRMDDPTPVLARLAGDNSTIRVQLKYAGPATREIHTACTLHLKGSGVDERWLVVERETDK